jgi:hypothetical protein
LETRLDSFSFARIRRPPKYNVAGSRKIKPNHLGLRAERRVENSIPYPIAIRPFGRGGSKCVMSYLARKERKQRPGFESRTSRGPRLFLESEEFKLDFLKTPTFYLSAICQNRWPNFRLPIDTRPNSLAMCALKFEDGQIGHMRHSPIALTAKRFTSRIATLPFGKVPGIPAAEVDESICTRRKR